MPCKPSLAKVLSKWRMAACNFGGVAEKEPLLSIGKRANTSSQSRSGQVGPFAHGFSLQPQFCTWRYRDLVQQTQVVDSDSWLGAAGRGLIEIVVAYGLRQDFEAPTSWTQACRGAGAASQDLSRLEAEQASSVEVHVLRLDPSLKGASS